MGVERVDKRPILASVVLLCGGSMVHDEQNRSHRGRSAAPERYVVTPFEREMNWTIHTSIVTSRRSCRQSTSDLMYLRASTERTNNPTRHSTRACNYAVNSGAQSEGCHRRLSPGCTPALDDHLVPRVQGRPSR